MKIIENPPPPPMRSNERGDHIVNLQDALLFLLEKGRLNLPDERRRDLEHLLRDERGQYLDGTTRFVTLFQEQYAERFRLDRNGEVDEPTARALNQLLTDSGAFEQPADEWIVRGQVIGADGPINGINISVFDRDLLFRRDGENTGQQLGTATTKRNESTKDEGWFEIKYNSQAFAEGDLAATDGALVPDLVFALSKDGQTLERIEIQRLPDGAILKEETILSADDLILGLQPRRHEEIRILVDGGLIRREPSEYERVWQAIALLLPGEAAPDAPAAERERAVCAAGEKLDEERHRDVSFIVRETEVPFGLVNLFVSACKFSAEAFDRAVPPVIFFGLARGDQELTDLAALATATANELKRALSNAVEKNYIPVLDDETFASSIDRIVGTAPLAKLNQTSIAGGFSFSDRLKAAVPETTEQTIMLRSYAENKGDPLKFWEELSARPEFADRAKIDRLQFALQIDALLQSHLPLMNALQTEHNLTSTRQLLDFGEDRLRELLLRPNIGVPADFPDEESGSEELRREQRVNNYITGVMSSLRLALPTETVAKVLREAPASHIGDADAQAALKTFFDNTTGDAPRTMGADFDIRTANIDNYLREHGDMAFRGISDEQRGKVVEGVKRSQRLFNVSSDSVTFEKLIGLGFDSAREIATYPQTMFLEMTKNELSADEAKIIHSRAANISTSSLHFYVMLNDAINGIYPDAVKATDAKSVEEIKEAVAKHVPNWQELFGSPEMCECGQCQSVYSPSAFLVELLQFLDKSGKNVDGFTPLDILIGKTDEATKKVLVMGRRPDIAHLKLTCENTNTALPYVDLVNEVLESLALAYATAAAEHGRITVDYRAIPAYDTGTTTTSELKANPQFSKEEAYFTPDQPNVRARLDKVAFPVNLPYDHSLETARVYLKHLGAELAGLLQKFGSEETRFRRAAEFLGLSPSDFEVLTGKEPDGADGELGRGIDELYGFAPELLPVLKSGDAGPLVRALKERLNTNGAALPLDPDPSKETFDAAAETAVKALQADRDLDPDGVVKLGEWNALNSVEPQVAGFLVGKVREFLHRMQISFEELDGLVRMRFLNSEQDVFDAMERLRIPTDDLLAFIAADFQNPGQGLLDALTAAAVTKEDFTAWATEHFTGEAFERLKKSLVLESPPDDPCNLDRTVLRRWDSASPAVDGATWHKLARLIRLWRITGWDIGDLDAVLVALGATDFTPDVIERLALVRGFQQELDFSVQQIVALWAPLDPRRPGTLYYKYFLSKAYLKHDAAFEPDWKGAVLQGAVIKDHVSALLAGLRLNSTDVGALLPDDSAALTLETVSFVARHAILARALGIGIKDLIGLKALTGIMNPFVAPIPDWPLSRFTELVQILQNVDLPATDLEYLLTGGIGSSPAAPSKDAVDLLIGEMNAALEQIEKDLAVADDPRGDISRTRLGSINDDTAAVNAFVQLLDGTAEYSAKLAALPAGIVFPVNLAKRLRFDKETKVLFCRGALTASEIGTLEALANDPGYKTAVGELGQKQRSVLDTALFKNTKKIKFDIPDAEAELVNKSSFNAEGSPDAAAVAGKFKWVVEKISPVLQDFEKREQIKQKLAENLGADVRLIERLIDRDETARILLDQPDNAGEPLIGDFVESETTAKVTAAYEKLHKLLLLTNTLGVTEDEIAQMHKTLVDLNILTFATIENLSRYALVRRQLRKSKTPLAAVFAAADKSTAAARLADATSWTKESIDSLTGPEGFNWTLAEFRDIQKIDLVRECVGLLKRLGVEAEQVFNWTRDAINVEQAEDIRRVTKAKYDDDSWLSVAKPLSDALRESDKNALVAYLLPRLDIDTGDQLYEKLLIDVEMSPCMMTSRVKQAISSVQLFVQRCLMNMEPLVPASTIDTQQWEWMQRYRIWEANRKVFLYPENWIEPELRDDKTPFFKELESDLLQTDVTDETVEQAVHNYLAKLDEVAKLEMCGIFVQSDFEAKEKKKEVVHVFGRTANQPQSYYYRQHVLTSNDVAYWTPWEKVPVDIRGNQLAAIVWNRRLYLFWALVSSKTEEPPTGTAKPEKGEPYDELQIAWSEYRNGKWSPKFVTDPEDALRLSVASPRLTAYIEAGNLVVVYEESRARLLCYGPGYNLNTGAATSAHGASEVFQKADGKFVFENCHGQLKLKREKWTKTGTNGYAVGPTDIQPLKNECVEMIPTLANFYPDRRIVEQQVRHSSYDYFIFEDNERAYLVRLEAEATGGGLVGMLDEKGFSTPYLKDKTPGIYDQYDTRFDLGRPFFDTLAVTTAVKDPWLSGSAKLASLRVQPEMRTLGGSIAGGLAVQDKFDKAVLGLSPIYDSFVRAPYAQLFYESLYHPFACEFMKRLERDGLPGILNLDCQKLVANPVFETRYEPNASHVAKPYPVEAVDFGQTENPAVYRKTAYSTYNWELFFHIPMFVAARLVSNQRFEDAVRWLQCVFNPTDGNGQYWKVLPFTTAPAERIEKMLEAVNAKEPEMLKQIAEWRDHPFQPHLIARLRLGAYQKNVVMKSIETVLACGDYYFRQDTIESINIATQYYVWCSSMLGAYPEKISTSGARSPKTFAELRNDLDAFGNAMKDFENKFPSYSGTSLVPAEAAVGLLGMRRSFYFCIPQNEKLLGYWDQVRDRLFKIRHCMNIEGVVRELPLFEPPIDPALLVQAAAHGISLSSVMNELGSSPPAQRFSYLLQKSVEICTDLKSLGSTLLSALEKRDSEKLMLIRQQHEKVILELVKTTREKQIDDAYAAIDVLNQTRDRAVERYLYYLKHLGVEDLTRPAPGAQIPMKPLPNKISSEGGAHLIEEEKNALDSSHSARDWQVRAATTQTLSSLSYYIPEMTVHVAPWGAGSSLEMGFGGKHVGPALNAIAQFQKNKAFEDDYRAGHSEKMALHVRRDMGNILQANEAAGEIMQIDKQVLAARIRIEIAKHDLATQEKQIRNAGVAEEFLTSKYTNETLYAWLEARAVELYFQYFQVASDWARKAERSFRFNLGLTTSNFIKPGVWDSFYKGLMAGETLQLQLRQMDRSYHEQNRREYEITKHASLLQINPSALIELRENGVCEFELPELLFDLDFPGHYFRRIKSVSVSVPCVVGPYASVSGTLTLLNNRIRQQNISAGYPEKTDEDDPRFMRDYIPLQSVATSTGQHDSGLFELNFRDERLLPFEGGGVISRWRFELPREYRHFEYATISDLILHIRYTAREGGEMLRAEANKAISAIVKADENRILTRMFSLRHEFPTQWHKLLNHAEANGDRKQSFAIAKGLFPFLFQGKKLKLYRIELMADPNSEDFDFSKMKLARFKEQSEEISEEIGLKDGEAIGHFVRRVGDVGSVEISNDPKKAKWGLVVNAADVEVTLNQVDDILVLCYYTAA